MLCFGMFSLISFSALAADTRYVVQKNDTLSGIAARFGLSVSALMKYNRLTQINIVHIGDVLRIPKRNAGQKESALSPVIRKKLDSLGVTRRKWKYIVIHHSATEAGTAESMDRYHREERHMENGLAYHFVVGNGRGMGDGEIAVGHRWIGQLNGGHLASETLNQKSIGICLVGNFDEERPTPKQIETLHALVSYLMNRCHLSAKAVQTHQQINPIFTRCPGLKFPAKAFLEDIKQKPG